MLRFARAFSGSSRRLIAKGDPVPSIALAEDAPSKHVDLSSVQGKYLIVGVPGAFSPGCSQSHVPGYLIHEKLFKDRGIENLYVVAVNDAFTTGAWKKALDIPEDGWARVLSDADGSFSERLDTLFDASKFFGNERSVRYAAIIEDGKVLQAFVEPDATGIDVSSAEKVLGAL